MTRSSSVLSRRYSRLLAAASGLLLAFAFPAADWNALAWVALVPLLWLLSGASPRAAFALGWIHGMAFYVGTLYWIVYTIGSYTPIPYPVAVIPLLLLCAVLSLYTGAFAVGTALTARAGIEPALFAPPWWVTLEWLRSWLGIGFPWVSLGYSQYRSHSLVQGAEITGVYGISFLVVLFNVVIASVLSQRGTLRSRAAQLVALTLLLASAQQFGTWRRRDLAHREPAHSLRAAVVQGNIPQERKWDPDYQETTITTYERLSREAAQHNVQLIVWPETAVPAFFQLDGPIAERVRTLAQATGVWLLFGSPGVEPDADGALRARNRVYLVSPDGQTAAYYDKLILVPFGEYVPLQPLLFFVDKVVEGAEGFAPGSGPHALAFGSHRAGVMICYEAIFPALARRLVASGADLLVNVTNDAWFGPTSAPFQHLAMASLRAVENRVPILRAANTGISAFVHPDGRIEQATELFQPAYRVVELSWPAVETVYRRYGDVFAVGCVIWSAGVGVACVRRRTRGIWVPA